MGSTYILGKNITDQSVYIFSNMPMDDIDIVWRYGIFRTPSLTSHAWVLGIYSLLIFTIYIYYAKKLKIAVAAPLLSGIFASVSRLAYGGFIFIILLQLIKRRKWIIFLLLIFICIFAIYETNIKHFNLLKITESSKRYENGKIDNLNIRTHTGQKALEIWKDHPFWGVGPGMFGGIVSIKYNSHFYNYGEYNIFPMAVLMLKQRGGIEQFWFQILAEMGIAGTLFFINFIIMLFIVLYKARKHADSDEIRNLFSALMIFMGCILIYSIGSGINIAPVLFTYCAFVGIGLGSYSNLRNK